MAWISGYQNWLSESEALNNAQMVVSHFIGTDWTKGSLSALCGNMRHESSLNPDMYEFGYDWDANRGYGLVQWTPRSKYWDWAVDRSFNPRSGDAQLERIDYEVEQNIQWIPNGHALRYGESDKYDMSFAEFRANTFNYSVQSLTEAFMWNYEGPAYSAGLGSLSDRQAFAVKCYQTLDWTGTKTGGGGLDPGTGGNGDEEKKKSDALIHMLLSGTMSWWG